MTHCFFSSQNRAVAFLTKKEYIPLETEKRPRSAIFILIGRRKIKISPHAHKVYKKLLCQPVLQL
jgi:hypothetical protein